MNYQNRQEQIDNLYVLRKNVERGIINPDTLLKNNIITPEEVEKIKVNGVGQGSLEAEKAKVKYYTLDNMVS